MIDTGSTCSIISTGLYNKLDLTDDLRIQGPKIPLKLADGSIAYAEGNASFKIQMGHNDKVIQHTMLVANIHTPIILGTDFLLKKQCILDMGKATLQVNKITEQTKAKEVKTRHSVFKISLAEDIKIPPRSEIILPTKMPHKPDFKTGIIEGRQTTINGGAITITNSESSKHVKPCTIYKTEHYIGYMRRSNSYYQKQTFPK